MESEQKRPKLFIAKPDPLIEVLHMVEICREWLGVEQALRDTER